MADYTELLNKLADCLAGTTLLNDLIIKKILGMPNDSEQRLLSFLNAVLKQVNGPVLTNVKILDRVNYPENKEQKITYLDIKAQDDKGRWYNVEVQNYEQDPFVSRFIYYVTRLHSSQLTEGNDYSSIRPTIGIALTNYKVFKDSNSPFRTFGILEQGNADVCLSPDLQFYFIQMPYLTSDTLAYINHELGNWLEFLNFPFTPTEKMNTIMTENTLLAHTGEVLYDFAEIHHDLLEAQEKARRNRVADEQTFQRKLAEQLAAQLAEQEEMYIAAGRAEGEILGKINFIKKNVNRYLNGVLSEYSLDNLATLTPDELDDIAMQIRDLDSIAQLEQLIDQTAKKQ